MFTCELCDYSTTIRHHFNQHLQTQKHIEIHYEYLKNENSTLINNEKEEIFKNKLLEKELENYKNQIEDQKNQLLGKDKIIDDMSKHIDDLMKMSNNITYMTNTTKNLFKIIGANSKAKAFAQIENYDDLMQDYSSLAEFASDMIWKYNKSLFAKCVGDFIANSYKKDDPFEQSVFNCDVARNNYKYIENDSKLYEDKAGSQTMHIAIKPVLQYIRKKLIKYFTDDRLDHIIRNNGNYERAVKEHASSKKLIHDIDIGTMERDVLIYISKQLPLSGAQQKLIEDMNKPKKRKYTRKQLVIE